MARTREGRCLNYPGAGAVPLAKPAIAHGSARESTCYVGDYWRYIDDRPGFRQFFCPGCGALIENEIVRADDEVLHDIALRLR